MYDSDKRHLPPSQGRDSRVGGQAAVISRLHSVVIFIELKHIVGIPAVRLQIEKEKRINRRATGPKAKPPPAPPQDQHTPPLKYSVLQRTLPPQLLQDQHTSYFSARGMGC